VRFKEQFVQLASCETAKITEAAFVPHAMQKWKDLQLAEDIWHQEFRNSDVVSMERNPTPFSPCSHSLANELPTAMYASAHKYADP